MTDVNNLITDNINVWTSAIKKRNSQGRGSNSKVELTGVKKLRELILELAVRGRLVPQDPNDEPASVLLDKITQEKEQLLKDKLIKKPKKLADITEDEMFTSLPTGWEFVRLNDLGEWGAGATPRRGNSELYGGAIPWFKSGELSADYIEKSEETVTELALKQSSLRYNKIGDVLLAMYGATIGKTAILKVRATTNQAVCACTPFTGFSNIFLLTLLKAYRPRFIDMGAGGAQPNISREKIIATVIVLPPLAEQHRIVAKVDELMALCGQLEQQTEQSLLAHQTLVEALLNTLTQSVNADDFQENWQRIADHFDVLFTTEASIEQLKQTILQLAVMGKLVPQASRKVRKSPNYEPASKLLEKIAEEKAQLIADKKIKKQKLLPEITDEEKPFELPTGWEWCRLGDLGYDLGGGTPSKAKQEYWNGNIPWISPKDMKVNYISSSQDYVTEQAINGSSAKDIPVGSLLMVVRGMILAHSFPVAITEVPVVINQDMKALVFSNVDKDFLLLMMQSIKDNVVELVDRSSHGTCKLVSDKLWSKAIPIPPLQEQHRIVAKVDELIALCDQLKTRLADAQTIQLHLADAVVENALN